VPRPRAEQHVGGELIVSGRDHVVHGYRDYCKAAPAAGTGCDVTQGDYDTGGQQFGRAKQQLYTQTNNIYALLIKNFYSDINTC